MEQRTAVSLSNSIFMQITVLGDVLALCGVPVLNCNLVYLLIFQLSLYLVECYFGPLRVLA